VPLDSPVAKIVVWAEDRPTRWTACSGALKETTVEGIHTTLPLHQRGFHAAFRQGEVFTDFLARNLSMVSW